MDREAHEPLNPPLNADEAKAQLRAAASHLGLVAWVRRQPLDAMVVGVLSGFLIGRFPQLWLRMGKGVRRGSSIARQVLGHLT